MKRKIGWSLLALIVIAAIGFFDSVRAISKAP